MANYAIMRCSKLKTMGSVASSLQHNFRERETPNADAERTSENEHLAANSTDEAMGKLRELLPEKRRKDAVVAVEYLFATSPEWAESASEAAQALFFENAVCWLENKFGRCNVVVASIQRDETTPHLSAFVVPITQDGRLSAKEFIGNKAKMSADQDTFAEAVKEIGLERGIKGSKAKHQTIRQYYARVNSAERGEIKLEKITEIAKDLVPSVTKKGFFSRTIETREAIAKRVIDKHLSPLAKSMVSLQEELKAEKKRGFSLNKQAAKQPSNLSKKEITRLLGMVSEEKRNQRELERQEKREKNQNGPERGFSR